MKIIPFKIAKTLKEKGYSQEPKHLCLNCYYEYDGLRKITPLYTEAVWYESACRKYLYSAPSTSQVLNWLRDIHGIFIIVFLSDDTDKPVTYEIYRDTECIYHHHGKYFSLQDWDKANLDAIEYTLDKFI